MEFHILTPQNPTHETFSREVVAGFLFKHLDQYGDKLEDIHKCLDYALDPARGGFALIGYENDDILGITIINHTGMEGYIPSNILVYIAVNNEFRGKGIGKQLMHKALSLTEGGVALHVEPDNPARFLYEKLGFTNKYLEMRYQP